MLTPAHLDQDGKMKPKAKLEELDRSIGSYVYSFEPDLTIEQANTLAALGARLTYRNKVAVKKNGQTATLPEIVLQVSANMGLSRVLSFFDRINASGIAEIVLTTEAYPRDIDRFVDLQKGERLKCRVSMTAAHKVDLARTGFVVVGRDGNETGGFIMVNLPINSTMIGALQTLRGELSRMFYVDREGITIVGKMFF